MKWLSRAWLGLILVAIASPTALVVINSFNASPFSAFPPTGLALTWYEQVFAYSPFLSSFEYSLALALGASLLATTVGVMAAVALTRYDFPGKTALRALLTAPLIAPRVAIGLSGYVLFVVLALHIGNIGLQDDPLPLLIIHTLFGMPLVLIIVSAALAGYDNSLDEAARDLGASQITVLRRITVPLLWGSVIIAAALAFVTSFDETEASLFFATTSGTTLPMQMFYFLEQDQTPTIAALSTLVLAASSATMGMALLVGGARRSVSGFVGMGRDTSRG